ncbi:MAG: lysoplasmalogenase family protein [Defluviitaleaceae bacterium]|nr:lysoplasmalogenase family protein [Defluviitaleaceae bacterium]MCL2263698.1 lysoplasmalogenase family protein [Defluviitaleaceae bacterium]
MGKKDWLCLVGGLVFTLLADYFLVLRQQHLFGVAAFCFVHVFYIRRAINFRRWMLVAFAVIWLFIVFILQSVILIAAVYASLFAFNIFVNYKTRRPKFNYHLVMAGLILFALCDINVMLFNIPRYTGLPDFFPGAFALIWVFYLPSQILLALSAVDYGDSR